MRKTPRSVPSTCSFCLLGTTKQKPAMPRDVGSAPPSYLHQRCGFAFSFPEKDRFTKQVSCPIAVEGFLIRCSTTAACRESAHQTRSMTCKLRPNAHVGPHDHIKHWLEMRTERPHLSNRRFHGTVALDRMSWCRSRTCRLSSDSCQLLSQFAYRCFAVGLYNHGRPNTDVSRKIGRLASCIQKETREGCFLKLQKHLCSAPK